MTNTNDSGAGSLRDAIAQATQPGYGPGGAPLIALNGAAAPNHALYLNGANRVLAAQAAYADTGVVPELLAIYHLLADPGMRIRQDQRESGGRRIRGPSG